MGCVDESVPSKSRFGVWGLIIPIALAATGAGILLYSRWSLDIYRPGNWLGRMSFLPGIEHILLALFCALAALITAFIFRPKDLFHGFWIVGLGLLVWMLRSPKGAWEEGEIRDLPHAMARYKAEIAQYKGAVATKRPFGDQITAKGGGRELIYWRWAQYGIDNAVGLVYDPLDKYPAIEGDFLLFEGQTGGHVWRTKRVEPRWILVWHS